MTITIYHNPKCGTSRNTLALIRNSGDEPVVIEYLKQPPSKEVLKNMLTTMAFSARELMRQKESLYEELQLAEDKWSEDALIDLMLAHPILINRPIVITPLGMKLCRPSELVLDILPSSQRGAFTKEDGEQLIDASGKRV